MMGLRNNPLNDYSIQTVTYKGFLDGILCVT